VPAEGTFVGYNRIAGLWDRGVGKGALLLQERRILSAGDGQPVATVRQLSLLRGDGGFGEGASEGTAPAPHPMPERAPDAVCDLTTNPSAALLYRLCGDLNPLHADPTVARAAGFERPILHGMATMGVAAHAVLRTLLGYDVSAFAGMRVRFTAAAVPGDTLRTEMWQDGQKISLRMTAVERNAVVLNHACVTLRPVRLNSEEYIS
jgi:acyl dehydratase